MLKYFAVAAVLAAVAAAQPWPNTTMAPSSSTISIYECASSACQSGSCSLVSNIPQHQCIPLNNGMGQRAHCVNLPKARCIRQSLYMGRICNQTSVLLDTTRRCGACEPAPEGWGIIDCSTRDVVYRYGCDGRCGNCTKKISARVGECGHASIGGGNVTFTINAIVNCKSLIYYQNYADSQCTQPQGNVSTAIAGMECLGFDSNGQPAGAVEYQCNNDGAATAAKFNGKGIKSM